MDKFITNRLYLDLKPGKGEDLPELAEKLAENGRSLNLYKPVTGYNHDGRIRKVRIEKDLVAFGAKQIDEVFLNRNNLLNFERMGERFSVHTFKATYPTAALNFIKKNVVPESIHYFLKLPSCSKKKMSGSAYVEIALSLARRAVLSIGASHIFREGMLGLTSLQILHEKEVTMKMLLGPSKFDLTQVSTENWGEYIAILHTQSGIEIKIYVY